MFFKRNKRNLIRVNESELLYLDGNSDKLFLLTKGEEI